MQIKNLANDSLLKHFCINLFSNIDHIYLCLRFQLKVSIANQRGTEWACDQDIAYAPRFIACPGMRQGRGPASVVRRREQVSGTQEPGLLQVSGNQHISDPPGSPTCTCSQLHCQKEIIMTASHQQPPQTSLPPSAFAMSTIKASCENWRSKRKSSSCFWPSAKLVFKTLSNTSYNMIVCSAYQVPVLPPCRKDWGRSKVGATH